MAKRGRKEDTPSKARAAFALALVRHWNRGFEGNLLSQLSEDIYLRWGSKTTTLPSLYGVRVAHDSLAAREVLDDWLVSRGLIGKSSRPRRAVSWIVDYMEDFCLSWRNPDHESRIDVILGLAKPKPTLPEWWAELPKRGLPPPPGPPRFYLPERGEDEDDKDFMKRCKKEFRRWLPVAIKPPSAPKTISRRMYVPKSDKVQTCEELLMKVCYNWPPREIRQVLAAPEESNYANNLRRRVSDLAGLLGISLPSKKLPKKSVHARPADTAKN